MTLELDTVKHPRSGKYFTGERLQPGAVLQKDDVYDGAAGSWEKCPCYLVGKPIETGCATIWLRPFKC